MRRKRKIRSSMNVPSISKDGGHSLTVSEIQSYLNAFDPKEFSLKVAETNKSWIKIQLDISDDSPDAEKFYLDLDLTQNITHVTKTNIPLLLPLQKLSEKYSHISDIKKLIEEISLLLKAYTKRKEQVTLFQERHKIHLINDIATTQMCDYVEFSLKLSSETGIITMGLSYNIKDVRPSEITYRWKGLAVLQPTVNDKMKMLQEVFKNEDLAEAFNKLLLPQ